MPPFVLLSLVGPAIALHNNETLKGAFPDRFYVSPALERIVAARKARLLRPRRRASTPRSRRCSRSRPSPVVLTAEEVREQTLSGLAEEARLMLDEGVVAAPQDIDLAMITGAGFSFWNGGLTFMLDVAGISEKATGSRFH